MLIDLIHESPPGILPLLLSSHSSLHLEHLLSNYQVPGIGCGDAKMVPALPQDWLGSSWNTETSWVMIIHHRNHQEKRETNCYDCLGLFRAGFSNLCVHQKGLLGPR